MNVIQEATVRQLYLKENRQEIQVCRGDYVTQQAMDYIREKGLTLVVADPLPENRAIRPAAEMKSAPMATQDGHPLEEKPEHMTHLYGNVLVPKRHPRIALRGRLDSLEADIICLQVQTDGGGDHALTEALGQLLGFCRSILSCEVTGAPLAETALLGLDAQGLRDCSQHPKTHFGIGHLLPDYRLGAVSAALNRLRTQTREVELAAVEAFCQPDGTVERVDLLRALNRLSSAFYILMLQREKARG